METIYHYEDDILIVKKMLNKSKVLLNMLCKRNKTFSITDEQIDVTNKLLVLNEEKRKLSIIPINRKG